MFPCRPRKHGAVIEKSAYFIASEKGIFISRWARRAGGETSAGRVLIKLPRMAKNFLAYICTSQMNWFARVRIADGGHKPATKK